jgi:hypothetical protein
MPLSHHMNAQWKVAFQLLNYMNGEKVALSIILLMNPNNTSAVNFLKK